MLDSANLFSTLVEAQSLNDALQRLQSQDYDSCLIGASVSAENASRFVSAARKISRTRDCSFIVLTKEADGRVPNADAVLSWPCSRKVLHEKLVSTIRKSTVEPVQTPAAQDAAMSTEYLIEHQARRLARIQRQIRAGRLGLNSLGRPDTNTENELRKIVDGILAHRVNRSELPTVRRAMLHALRGWVTALVIGSHKEANEQLHAALKELLVHPKTASSPALAA